MSIQTVVVPTSGVEGNITSCEIKTQLINIDRENAFSIIQNNTYISYDVCTKEITNTYVIEEMTPMIGLWAMVVIVVLFIVAAIGSSW